MRSGLVAGMVRPMSAALVEEAICLAQQSFSRTRAMSSFDRATVLEGLARALVADAAGIAKSIVAESGYLNEHDMLFEVQRAVEACTMTAAHVRSGLSEALNLDSVERARGTIGILRRVPIGPVLGITAFNGPLLIGVHKVAAAIGAGAPIILKPAPRVPQAAMALARLLIASGWPAEGIAVLDADDGTTMALIQDARLPVISFTGGDFGWKIRAAVPRKRVHLELGGIGAVLVAADADLERAARECAVAAFVRSGQSCISVQRIYVVASAYQQFVRLFRDHIETADRAAPVDPLVNEAAACRVQDLVTDALQHGARRLLGADRVGSFLPRTLLVDASDAMRVMREEAFGPVVAVQAVSCIDEGVRKINAVSGAIHHGIFTQDIDAAMDMAERIVAAGVVINGPGTWRVDHMPYGGIGSSGTGREGARHGIEEFTDVKVIVLRGHPAKH